MLHIADYEVVGPADVGNHGALYPARPPARLGLGDDVVTVKLLDDVATDRAFERMANELRALAGTPSDHLVRVLEAGHVGGRLFFAMRYGPGSTLAHLAERLDPITKLTILADAARGAHDLHEAGVVHRDIKPATVVVSEGRGRLADLGLARFTAPGMTTTGGGPVGSIEYMEPAVIMGDRAGRASDIWSLGLTVHRVMAGTSAYGPLPADNVLEAFRHVVRTPPQVSEELAPAVAAVVRRATQPARADRYPTAAAMAEELDEAVPR